MIGRALLAGSRRQRLGNRPFAPKTVLDESRRDAGTLAPLCDSAGHPVVFDDVVVCLISGLFRFGGPSDVPRLVSPRPVDSVQRVARRRLRSHVCEERFERVGPTVADGDSPCSVVLVVRLVGISAPLQHPLPNPVLPRSGLPVRAALGTDGFALKTTAAPGFPSRESVCWHDRFGAALAPTFPTPSAVVPVVESDDGQLAEHHPGQITRVAARHNKTLLRRARSGEVGRCPESTSSAGNYSALAPFDCGSILP